MVRPLPAQLAALCLVTAAAGCRTPAGPAGASVQSVVVPDAGDTGYTTFVAEGGQIHRYRCPQAVLGQGTDQVPLDDPKFLKAKCQDTPSRTGAPVGAKDLEARLRAAYLQRVEDTALNVQEADVLQFLMAALQAPAGAAPALVMTVHEQHAMGQIQARFAGLLEVAYDNAAAEPARSTVKDSTGKAGLNLAGGAVALGQVKFKSSFSGAVPFNLTMNVTGVTEAVATVALTTTLDPSGVCKTRVLGVASVTAQTPSGPKTVSVVPHPVKANAWRINNGTPVVVTRLVVSVKKPPLTTSQNCVLVATGEDGGDTPPPPPPTVDRDTQMKAVMATRSHRMWHYLWHGIRNAWPRMSAQDRATIRQVLGQGWARSNAETLQNPAAAKGEEFFHMHRFMIGMVQGVLGDKMYERWAQPPGLNDPKFPVPGGITIQAQNDVQQFAQWHKQATDPVRLRSMTFGQFGEWLESTLHNGMHMHWSDPATANDEVMAGGLLDTPKPEWDDPRNDYLGSTYSSHVNPIFWRLHGYVDDRANDWLKANGYDRAADDCAGQAKCYQWKGNWDGPAPMADRGLEQPATVGAGQGQSGVPQGEDEFDPEAFRELPRELARLINENSVMMPVADE